MNVNLFGLRVFKQCLGVALSPFKELPSLNESSLGLHSELPIGSAENWIGQKC